MLLRYALPMRNWHGGIVGRAALILVLTLVFVPRAAGAGAGEGPPAVLLLASYHHGDPWTDRVVEGFLSALAPDTARVFVEHLDARRFPETGDRTIFSAYLAGKYQETPPVVLACADDAALNFWLTWRDRLFPGRPIVFCGVNDFTPARIAGYADITGVSESPDVLGTLELALDLVPSAHAVLALASDTSVTGRANLERLRRAVTALGRRVRSVEIVNASLEAAAAALAAAPRDAVVLRLMPLLDAAGGVVPLGPDMAVLTAASTVPVFGLWDFDLGHGSVGGRVVRGPGQGRAAAVMVASILAGTPAGDIPVAATPIETVLDYKAMERFSIPTGRAPMGAVFENAPASSYARYKPLIWSGAAALGVAVPLILVLAWLLASRRRAESLLAEGERRYRELVESANTLILRFDATGRLVFVNDYAERLLGYTRQEMLAGEAVFWPSAPPDLSSLLARAMASPQSLANGVSDNAVTTKDGRRISLQWDNRALNDEAGNPAGWLAVGSDITARRQAEEALAARAVAEEELALFGRELLADAPDAVDRGLVRLLTAFSLGRAVWFSNIDDPTLGLCCRLAGEACVAGLTPRRGEAGLELIPYSIDGFQWADRLAAGEILSGLAGDFPDTIQALLQIFGVAAVLAAPVTQHGTFAGFLAVGEVRQERRFSRQEEALLSTAASLLSAHLSRGRQEPELPDDPDAAGS
ncbi:PAS domain S-box protein [Solidesulfovibrio sp.]